MAAVPVPRRDLFINGAWVPTPGRLDVVNPATERVIGQIPAATSADVNAAVEAASAAHKSGVWARMSGTERAGYLRKMAALVRCAAYSIYEMPHNMCKLTCIAVQRRGASQLGHILHVRSRRRPSFLALDCYHGTSAWILYYSHDNCAFEPRRSSFSCVLPVQHENCCPRRSSISCSGLQPAAYTQPLTYVPI